MTEPIISEIRTFAAAIPPRGWAMCDGQLVQFSEHPALFELIGTSYNGNGQRVFSLPDLRGRVPVMAGSAADRRGPSPGESGHLVTASPSGRNVERVPFQAVNFIIALEGIFPERG